MFKEIELGFQAINLKKCMPYFKKCSKAIGCKSCYVVFGKDLAKFL